MKTIKQGETVLSGGKRRPNYFNGRVLTAEALQEEQTAQQSRFEDLGRGIGEGVVVGLDVRPADGEPPVTSIVVTQGTAATRAGSLLELVQPVTVELTPSAEPGTESTGADFTVCATEPGGETVLSGQGLYLVTLARAVGLEGRAPRVGLGGGEASGCGRRYVVEGVTIRLRDASDLIPVEPAVGSAASAAAERNLIAHAALGSLRAEERVAELADILTAARTALLDPAAPFDPPGGRDPLDRLRETGHLPEDEAPLALLQWTDDGIAFVDVWAVRRRVHTPVRAALAQVPADDARQAVAEAALRQFETHVANDELSLGDVFGMFRFLPAAGLLQLSESQAATFSRSIHVFLRARQQTQQIAALVEVSQEVMGEERGAHTLEMLRRYFEELGAWTAYARILEQEDSDLIGEIVSADEHADFLRESEDEAEDVVEELLAPLTDTVHAEEFINAATAQGENSVQLRMALSLPWWMVDIDISLIDGAEVGVLFNHSFQQPPLFIRQLSLQRLRERVSRGEATRADLSRRLVPSVQLHIVRDSLPTEITDVTEGSVEDEPSDISVDNVFLLFSRQTARVPIGQFPKPWPVPEEPSEDGGFRTVVTTIDSGTASRGFDIGEEFVSKEVRDLKENLNVSTKEAELLFDRYGVREAGDLSKIGSRELGRVLKLNPTETNKLLNKVYRRF